MLIKFEYIKAHLLIFVATCLVSISFIVSEKVAGIIDPISLTLLRFIISFIALAPLIYAVKKFRNKIKSSILKGFIISFFYSMFFIILFKSLEITSSLNTSTLFTLVPFTTAVISFLIFKENLNSYKISIYILGVLGTSIVVLSDNIADLMLFNKGDLLFLIGVIFMSLYSVSTKYFYDSKNDEVLVLTFTTLLGGIVWMTLAVLILDISLMWEKIEYQDFGYIIYLSIAATLLTVYLYQKGTISLGPNRTMAYTYLNPAIVVLILYLVENKEMNILILCGIFLSSSATLMLLKGVKDSQN